MPTIASERVHGIANNDTFIDPKPPVRNWPTTRGCERNDRSDFIEMMQSLNLTLPTHVTEALRTNMTGGKKVAQMLSEAAAIVPFMSLVELSTRPECGREDLIVLDVREREAFEEFELPASWFVVAMMIL